MPLHRRLPKRGFTNIFRKEYAIVNLSTLDKLSGDTFGPDRVVELGVIKKKLDGLKILANGEITRAIHVTAHIFSKTAEEKIKAAGGSVTVIEKKSRIQPKA